MKPADNAKAAKAAISTVGSFFGKVRLDRRAGARNDARLRWRGIDVVARGRLAVFGEIGLEQIAFGLGVALERAQLNVLGIRLRNDLLDRIEAGSERLHPVAGHLGVVVELARQALALAADLALDFGDLRLQFLDARMLVEQRG